MKFDANLEQGKKMIADKWKNMDKRAKYGAIAGVATLVVSGSFIATAVIGAGVAFIANEQMKKGKV